jgi:hypothetical protein
MDLLDLGFNLVIGLVVLGIMIYIGLQIKRMIDKQTKEKNEEELDNLLKIEKVK